MVGPRDWAEVEAVMKASGSARLSARREGNEGVMGGGGEGADATPAAHEDSRYDAAVNWTYLRPWMLSLEVATVATLANALVAIPFSYYLARRRFAGKWLVESLVILPLVLPPTVIGFLLMYLLGRSGLYGVLTGETLLFTKTAAILASLRIRPS